jgi:type VI protein secretion system component VasK
MTPSSTETPPLANRRGMAAARARRPWLLIVASLLLAMLSAVLWAKWADSRIRAERLQAEIKVVYAEAETLRTEAARAQHRVFELERELRDLTTGSRAAAPKPKPPPRGR